MAIRNHPRRPQFPPLLRPLASMVPLQSLARGFIPGKSVETGYDRG